MKHPKHEDHRGFFQELLKSSDPDGYMKPEQVSWFTINAGKTRGNHYHKTTIEKFILLEGECKITLTSVFNPHNKLEFTLEESGESFFADTYMIHTFYSEQGCKILVLSNKEFDLKNPDTYVI